MTAENRYSSLQPITENSSYSNVKKKVENDPWVPLEMNTNVSLSNPSIVSIQSAPQNPLYQVIDSDKYIKTLETKLAKISKTRKSNQPTSKDIITSLAVFHEDQMRRFLNSDPLPSSSPATQEDHLTQSASFLHRRLHPERQPLSAEEIAELIKEDVLAEQFSELNTGSGSSDQQQATQLLPLASKQDASNRHKEPSSSFPNIIEESHSGEVSCSVVQPLHNSLPSQDQTSSAGKEEISIGNEGENWANFDQIDNEEVQS